MIDFYGEVKKVLDDRRALTENGAVGYATTGKALLDMNFKVPSYRDASEDVIISDFIKAYAEDPTLAIKWMFYVGDIRQGLGERRLFRVLMKHVMSQHTGFIKFVGEYNRFDSLFELFGTDAESDMINFVLKQLTEDMIATHNNKPCSLLAKWMPSINTSSKKTRELAKKFIKAMNIDDAEYRKMLSKLRANIDVTERKLCAGQWDKVNYNAVPSKANLKYNNAFLAHDEARRREFLDKLAKGDKDVKINAGACFPHDIVVKYRADQWSHCVNQNVDGTLEAMWKALPNTLGDKPMIVVRDGSGSMTVNVQRGSNVAALDVATALAIYCAERLPEPYKNKFITFSEHPKMVSLAGIDTLHDKLHVAYNEAECANTNIEAVFDLILQTAVRAGIKQKDIPDILIISDMEFDGCACDNAHAAQSWGRGLAPTLFQSIGAKYQAAGYQLPKLVFWNVNSRTNTIPVKENDMGVVLMSGFSQNTVKMAMSNKLDPYAALKETLNVNRYAFVDDVMLEVE